MDHRFYNVTGLGYVAVSSHAEERRIEQGISEHEFIRTLLAPVRPDIPEGHDTLWRERNGLRLVILTGLSNGANLVKTMYRVQPQRRVG